MEYSESACKVKINYFGAIAGVVKMRSEDILLPREGATIGRIFSTLEEVHGKKFGELISRDSTHSPVVTIFVNGESVSSNADLARYVLDGSEVEVSLINQMSGG